MHAPRKWVKAGVKTGVKRGKGKAKRETSPRGVRAMCRASWPHRPDHYRANRGARAREFSGRFIRVRESPRPKRRAARPIGYNERQPPTSGFAPERRARSLVWSGLVVEPDPRRTSRPAHATVAFFSLLNRERS